MGTVSEEAWAVAVPLELVSACEAKCIDKPGCMLFCGAGWTC